MLNHVKGHSLKPNEIRQILQVGPGPNPRNKEIPGRSQGVDLSKLRFIIPEVVYLLKVPRNLQDSTFLQNEKYLGQYGNIRELVIGPKGSYSTIYVRYENSFQATLALLAMNSPLKKVERIEARYGETFYCENYLKMRQCKSSNCKRIHKKLERGYFYLLGDFNQQLFQFQVAGSILRQNKVLMRESLHGPKANDISNEFPSIHAMCAYFQLEKCLHSNWMYEDQIESLDRIYTCTHPNNNEIDDLLRDIDSVICEESKKENTDMQSELDIELNPPGHSDMIMWGISHIDLNLLDIDTLSYFEFYDDFEHIERYTRSHINHTSSIEIRDPLFYQLSSIQNYPCLLSSIENQQPLIQDPMRNLMDELSEPRRASPLVESIGEKELSDSSTSKSPQISRKRVTVTVETDETPILFNSRGLKRRNKLELKKKKRKETSAPNLQIPEQLQEVKFEVEVSKDEEEDPKDEEKSRDESKHAEAEFHQYYTLDIEDADDLDKWKYAQYHLIKDDLTKKNKKREKQKIRKRVESEASRRKILAVCLQAVEGATPEHRDEGQESSESVCGEDITFIEDCDNEGEDYDSLESKVDLISYNHDGYGFLSSEMGDKIPNEIYYTTAIKRIIACEYELDRFRKVKHIAHRLHAQLSAQDGPYSEILMMLKERSVCAGQVYFEKDEDCVKFIFPHENSTLMPSEKDYPL